MLERLNDPETINSIDISGMLGVLEAFPAQCRDAVSVAAKAEFGQPGNKFNAVAVLGMGASGIGGDIVKALYEPVLGLPVAVVKTYNLPAYKNSDSLVFAVSYSGDTEETLSAVAEAKDRKAHIIAVTSGGRLKEIAEAEGYPVVPAPAGLQPRAALGHLSLPVILGLEKQGLISGASEAISETLDVLEMMSEQMKADKPADGNIAKQLAGRLFGKLPVIYGSDGGPAVAALRWKCQLNENGKVPAYWNQFPDLDHNEIVGWQELPEIAEKCCLVTLRSEGEHPRVSKRVKVTLPLMENHVAESLQVWAEGESALSRLYSLIYLGDLVSVYLALLNGVDPTPVERIQLLKQKLREED
jgi:glucose/mannose-6-phosphate isomerase